ncbi:MAG: LmeA family phospholipid-binding protein [Jatrophihabitantaceae bacterium]
MVISLVVLAVLVLLALGLALADRMLAALAERKASAYLAEPFGHQPSVRVHGAPFLTQALRGRYRDVEVSGGGLRIGEISGATLNARLANIHLPPRELLSGRASELPCEGVSGRLVLPYGELARVSHVPGLALTFEQGRLIASASLPVPGISQLARVSGEATPTVVDGAAWLRVSGLSVAGLSLTALVLKQLMPRMNVPIPLPPLPWGLRLDGLDPTPAGLVASGSAAAVVFRSPNHPRDWESDPAS